MSAPFAGAPETYNKHLSLFCRAAGDGITFSVTDGGSYVLQNNSFAGYGTTSYDISCDGTCTKPNITYQNNLNIGIKSPRDGQPPAIFYTSTVPRNPFVARDHNLYFQMRSCPSGPEERCVDPKVVHLPAWKGEASLDDIDLHLATTSPARGAGVPVSDLTADFSGTARPAGGAPDVGAFQYHP
jgi:hypothetical protein